MYITPFNQSQRHINALFYSNMIYSVLLCLVQVRCTSSREFRRYAGGGLTDENINYSSRNAKEQSFDGEYSLLKNHSYD